MLSHLSDAPLPLAITFGQTVGWVAFGLIVVVGLFLFGLRDVSRFSLKRAWAISGVCFDESIRRRVLWIIPLAALGVIVVSQLQKPFDEQDAIRQTTKFALFATGLVVVVTTIILACTNLPREIENRVIYTIVTKPTTRLEIVLGKVIGFARVSLTILLIMGVFAYAYLALRAWSLRREIAARLDDGAVPELARPTLEHYRSTGLLTAKSLASPQALQVFAQLPTDQEAGSIWGDGEQDFVAAFDLPEGALIPPGDPTAAPGSQGLYVVLRVGFDADSPRRAKPAAADQDTAATTAPATTQAAADDAPPPYMGPFIVPEDQRSDASAAAAQPGLAVQFLDENFYGVAGGHAAVNAGQPVRLEDPTGSTPVRAFVTAPNAGELSKHRRLYAVVTGRQEDVRYFVRNDVPPVQLHVPSANPSEPPRVIEPAAPAADNAAAVAGVMFRGRDGQYGQQLRGARTEPAAPVAVVNFRDVETDAVEDGRVPFELRVGIERSGDDPTEEDNPTRLAVRARNVESGAISEPVTVTPESGRPAFFSLPADAVAGGDFDLLVQNRTGGHFVGLTPQSIAVVEGRQSFAFNLSKSLLILWLMSILVTAVAIFTSTFLSWPIAVVLTLVILLGHWGVSQLGDATQPGIGNTVATDLFGSSAANAGKYQAVSRSVEALSRFLNAVSAVLPDISQYSATEDIERGMAVTAARLGDAARVTFGFGIPLTVLAYVFLRNKEVAP
jgi:ABC-type transport system involved in multi-copper enzyme maturation permease subunit